MKLIKSYYNSDKNLVFEVAKEFGLGDYIKDRAIMSSGSIVKLRKMHNITANEVGLKAWPGKYKQPEKL